MLEGKKLLSDLNWRFVLALWFLAGLSFASYFILQENIRSQKGSAAIINISGRQRMLSQRIALFSLRIAGEPSSDIRQGLRKELQDIVGLMEKSHRTLSGASSDKIRRMYFAPPFFLDAQVRSYIQEADYLLSASDTAFNADNPHLQSIVKMSTGEFLLALDRAVKEYEEESERKVWWLERMQFLILFSTLFILIIAWVFIFRPMVSRLRQEAEELGRQMEQRTRLEDELRRTNEFDETLLRTIPLGIDIVDEDNNVLYLNERMKKVIGVGGPGGRCYLLYKDDRTQCQNCPLKADIQIGQTEEIEVSGVLGGRIFLITHTGMFYQGRKAILEVFEDITDYKKAQERLSQAERLSSIGRMAGVIAHEFRNQLGVIRNVSYFLKMKIADKDEKVRRHLGILDEQVSETERIIANILNFSRSRHPEMRTVDLPNLLRLSVEKVMPPAGIELELEVADTFALEADPVQLEGVFVNLLLNAVQAMEEKGRLLIRMEKTDNYVNIIFKDTGCGIKEEDKKKLFEPFFSTKARGTGLGLATAKVIVEGHQGRINIESRPGEGTTVTISLPILK